MKSPSRGGAAQVRPPRRPRRGAAQTALRLTIHPSNDHGLTEDSLRRFVEGMAQLAAELIIEGAFDARPEETSDPDGILPESTTRPA